MKLNDHMNFSEATQFLLGLSNIERQEYMKDARHCEVYLKRLQFLLNLCGHPERQVPHCLHITGTSGKGSVACYLAAIFTAAGYKTGANISPHPTVITERWQINNRPMSKKKLVELTNWLKPILNHYGQTSPYDYPSFFEITEALALKYFAEEKIDWLINEAACGGRFDATNIMPRKDAAIITNIGLDHVGVIGNNKAEIAWEKAGIIKAGALAFTEEKDPKILKIIQTECARQKVKLQIVPIKNYQIIKLDETGTDFIYQNKKYHLRAPGRHQINNAILSIAVARAFKISERAITAGLSSAHQPLRLETTRRSPLMILDGAHNPDKMKTTAETIKYFQKNKRFQNLHLVCGFAADKNHRTMLRQLASLAPKQVVFTRFETTGRIAANPQTLLTYMKAICPQTKLIINLEPKSAYEQALNSATPKDLVLVTGSIYLSGQLRPLALSKNIDKLTKPQ